jgi:phosphoesterase RecJ-like protein
MTMTAASLTSRERILTELREARRFVVIAHENPDGDAVGSLVAMQGILTALGKDCLTYISERDLPLPQEYRFLPLTNLVSQPPDDLEERTIVFLDCGNIDRNPAEAFRRPGVHILNVDHHHDNTRFGTVDHVVPEASCTAEILWDLMSGLGVRPSGPVADALYVGLITDTGRFMYENTGRRAHLMAADLIDAGVGVHDIYRHVYEGMPYGKLVLLARGLANVRRYDDGTLTISALSAGDFVSSGAEESYSEGVVDYLRAVQGTRLAALVRDRLNGANGASAGEGGPGASGGGGLRKVSLRAADDALDVSAIARAQGGGGHKQAAGFTTRLTDEELVHFLREQLAAQA